MTIEEMAKRSSSFMDNEKDYNTGYEHGYINGADTVLEMLEKLNQDMYNAEEWGAHEWQIIHDFISELKG